MKCNVIAFRFSEHKIEYTYVYCIYTYIHNKYDMMRVKMIRKVRETSI